MKLEYHCYFNWVSNIIIIRHSEGLMESMLKNEFLKKTLLRIPLPFGVASKVNVMAVAYELDAKKHELEVSIEIKIESGHI